MFPAIGRKKRETTLIDPVMIPAITALTPSVRAYPLMSGVTSIVENIKKNDAAITKITSRV